MRITHILMCSSPHVLLLYFLVAPFTVIKESTFFFFSSDSVNDRRRLKRFLPYSHIFDNVEIAGKRLRGMGGNKVLKFFLLFKIGCSLLVQCWGIRLFRFFLWPFLQTAEILGTDHLAFEAALIGRRTYTLIEDGLGNYSNSLIERIRLGKIPFVVLRSLIVGPLLRKCLGLGPQARKIIMTGLAELPDCYRGKVVEIVSMEKLWREALEEKKVFIRQFFDLTPEDLEVSRGRDVLFIAQPFAVDGLMTQEEQIVLIRKVLERYGVSKVALKPHPRETLNFVELFPEVCVLKKSVPMELMNLCGVTFSRVVTINSTAALNFSCEVELDWLGTDLDTHWFDHLSALSRGRFARFLKEVPLPDAVRKS